MEALRMTFNDIFKSSFVSKVAGFRWLIRCSASSRRF
jgi:hypothetical protein